MGLLFPPDYRRFLMEASDVIVGTIEPATITNPQSHTHLPDIANSAWSLGVDRSWLPICEDNGDYFCLTPRGAIAYWSHNGPTGEQWPDLAAWIQDVWLAES